MNLRIIEEPANIETLTGYSQVPMVFTVERVLAAEPITDGIGFRFVERVVDRPYVKDYRAAEAPDSIEQPVQWAKRWDLSNWRLFSAFDGRKRIGGAVVAWNTPGVYMLEDRKDMAVLWDICVLQEYRQHGLGTQLFQQVEAWARSKGCTLLKIETQNVNLPACRFYARMGCELGGLNRFAYPGWPDEVQLLWYKRL